MAKKKKTKKKKNKSRKIYYIVGAGLFILIILGILIFAGGDKLSKTKYDKILMIGIDGMDPRAMEQLMDGGKLPNFSKLKDSGSFDELGTSLSPQSPIAWTSIATGSNPGKHNIFDFIRRNPENYLPELSLVKSKAGISSTNYEPYVKGKQFWKITSEAGIPSTIIRWPLTFPTEETKGNLLAGLGVPDIKGLLNSYSFYSTEDYPKDEEGAEKIISVENKDDMIETVIKGPRTRESGKVVDVTVPMKIELEDDKATIIVQGNKYPVELNGWSDWVKPEFKVGILKKVTGICRFYLQSIKPFNMYMTTVEIDPENPTYPITYPVKYSKELAGEIGLYHTLGLPEDTNALNEDKISDEVFLELVEHIDDERNKMFWYEFERFEEGVFAFVFDGSDRIQHMFWEEKVIRDDVFSIHPAIVKYLVEKDKFIGEVLDKIDDKTALIIFSDHGISSFERGVSMNTWLSENGYMTLTEKPTEKNSGELFRFVDWEKTKAYSVGFTSIFINEKGREGKGIVDPKDKDALIDEIIGKLKKLEDKELKNNVMTDVYKASDVYSGDYVSEGPDMVVGFAPGYRMGWQNAIGGVTLDIFSDNDKHWKADHLIDPSHVPGTIFSNFKITKKNPHQMDIAPTVLDMLGISIPEEMDGTSLV